MFTCIKKPAPPSGSVLTRSEESGPGDLTSLVQHQLFLFQADHPTKAGTNFRSPYEEQLEQQRLAARRDEEAQRLREHQEALHQQRLRDHLLRQQQQEQLLAREGAPQKQAEHEEDRQPQQQHPEQLRYPAPSFGGVDDPSSGVRSALWMCCLGTHGKRAVSYGSSGHGRKTYWANKC